MEQRLKNAIEDLAEWVVDNLDDPTPLVFKDEEAQELLEKIVKEWRQK